MRFKWSDEKIIKYVEDSGYVFINFIENNKTGLSRRLIVKCDNHDPYEVTFSNFFNGRRCMKCSRKYTYSYEEVNEYIFNEGDKLLTLKDEHKNNLSQIKVLCSCGNIFLTTFSRYKTIGNRCPICSKEKIGRHNRLNTDVFLKKINEIGYEFITPIEEYKNEETKFKVKCNNGHIFTTYWKKFNGGCRCPICNRSKGETRIENNLRMLNIKYASQKTYNDLLSDYGKMLRFDFYLPDFNLLIEYQGEFHDGNVRHQNKHQLERQKKYDKRKREYVKTHNINLLEIWYWDFDNIEKILMHELIK